MTPLSAELFAAPAALMVLLVMMWFRRNRAVRAGADHVAPDEGMDERFTRSVSIGRSGALATDPSYDELAATGVFEMPEVAEAPSADQTSAGEHVALPQVGDAVFGPTTDVDADVPDWEAMPLPERTAPATPERDPLAEVYAPEAAGVTEDDQVVDPPVEDAVFGPTTDVDADEPDWEAMRLPQRAAPATPEHEPLAEVYAPEAAEVTEDHRFAVDELITRPGWPLPGDLDAWENTDLEPLVGAERGGPSVDLWAELAAEGPAERVSDGAGSKVPTQDPGADAIVFGAPYSAPGLAPPAGLSELTAPTSGETGETPPQSIGGVGDSPGSSAVPSSDPSYWDVTGLGSYGDDVDNSDRFDPTHAAVINGSDAWPPQAPNAGDAPWAAGTPDDPQSSVLGETTARELAGANAASTGAGSLHDWWSADSAPSSGQMPDGSSQNGATVGPMTQEFGGADQLAHADNWTSRPGDPSGMQRPALPEIESAELTDPAMAETPSSESDDGAWWGDHSEAAVTAADDWWNAAGPGQRAPSAGDVESHGAAWATTSVAADPHPAPVSTAGAPGLGDPLAVATVGEILGAAPVATAPDEQPERKSAPRVLPRLDASEHNRHTAGRFAVGGSAVGAGDGAFTRVHFRAPFDRPILGWAVGDGPHHAPGTLVLIVDAVLNCSTGGLSVLLEDADPNRPDGFTLSLSSDGPGPFAVSGRFYVVTA